MFELAHANAPEQLNLDNVGHTTDTLENSNMLKGKSIQAALSQSGQFSNIQFRGKIGGKLLELSHFDGLTEASQILPGTEQSSSSGNHGVGIGKILSVKVGVKEQIVLGSITTQ